VVTVTVKNLSYKKPPYTLHKISFLCSSMSLFITSLNSGSNGNCYYIGNNTEAILVDAGISCREIGKRMKRLGLKIENVKAVFVSHEHTDHVNGLPTLIKKYQIPVYITPLTMKHGGLIFEEKLIHTFVSHQPVIIDGLTIIAFPKFHDVSDPYSFVISCDDAFVGVFTDIGVPCRHVKKYFPQCNAAFLEANYDEEMLNNGTYPVYLKNRIRGGMGHLGNQQALELFVSYRSKFMSHLILSHLSKNNNSPELVQQLFDNNAGDVKIIVASRYQETDVFYIDGKSTLKPAANVNRKKQSSIQLSFSFA